MIIIPALLAAITDRPVNGNMQASIRGLAMRPGGLSAPHRLCHFLGQVAHESGLWRFDHEIWGPTPAQLRYEGRADLGNVHPGDGWAYRGRGPIQITGRSNYSAFTAWARLNYEKAPDFLANPDAVLSDPWEGLSAIWYWETRNLNAVADVGDIELVTRRINGGTNGLADRVKLTVEFGIALAGFKTVRAFQMANTLTPDGVAGPITRGVLHKILLHQPSVTFALS
mgnify:CR=1 FL=1